MIKTSYADQPCERCGSKKSIAIIHKVVSSITPAGSKIEYSQIVCTNKVCQEEFDKRLQEKIQRDKAIQLKRAEDKARKAHN